ncbi:MAG: amidohydrolase family protein [Bacteroidia bacterium]
MNLKKHISLSSLFFFILSGPPTASSQTSTQFVIKNVSVITMASPNEITSNATVVIKDNHIESINGSFPENAKIIDGKGKYLIPGLIDVHVHLLTDKSFGRKTPTQKPDLTFNTQDIMTPLIANGVTTVLDLNSTMETFSEKKEIEKGYVIGPRIALAALINGGTGEGRIANTAEEGRIMVRNAKAEGYDFIKTYSQLSVEAFTAIVDEAYKQGLKTVGHIPNAFKGNLEKAFVPHFGMVAHAEEFSKYSDSFDIQDALNFAKLAKDNGTWLSPTLTTIVWIAKQTHSIECIQNSPTLKYVHPLIQSKWLTANNYVKRATLENAAYFDNMVKFHFQLVKSFKEAGVPIVAGTDAGVSGVVLGFSLHDELELLVEAGLTPEEALNSATILPARWLGIDTQLGTIETGKLADLILLDDNPLTDIKNARKIAGVFVNGKWLDRKELNKRLFDLASRNTALRDKFDWERTINKSKK